MKRILISLLLLGTVFCPLAMANTPTKQPLKTSLLFVVSADNGTVQQTQHGYRLILDGTHPSVLYFSDRPKRLAGTLPTPVFFEKIWSAGKNNFQADHPNAAIAHAKMDAYQHGTDTPWAVDLVGKPKHLGKHRWSFLVHFIGNTQQPLPKSLPLGRVTLFIDNISVDACISEFPPYVLCTPKPPKTAQSHSPYSTKKALSKLKKNTAKKLALAGK
jgi:hypothetical protein